MINQPYLISSTVQRSSQDDRLTGHIFIVINCGSHQNEFKTTVYGDESKEEIIRKLYKPKVGESVKPDEFIKEKEIIILVTDIILKNIGIDGKISKEKLICDDDLKSVNEKLTSFVFKDVLQNLEIKTYLTHSQARESLDEYFIIDVIHEC